MIRLDFWMVGVKLRIYVLRSEVTSSEIYVGTGMFDMNSCRFVVFFFMKWERNMLIPEKLFIIFRSTIKYYKSFITLLQLTLALINRADVIIEKKVFFYLVYH